MPDEAVGGRSPLEPTWAIGCQGRWTFVLFGNSIIFEPFFIHVFNKIRSVLPRHPSQTCNRPTRGVAGTIYGQPTFQHRSFSPKNVEICLLSTELVLHKGFDR